MVMQKHDFPQRIHDSQIDYHAMITMIQLPPMMAQRRSIWHCRVWRIQKKNADLNMVIWMQEVGYTPRPPNNLMQIEN